MDLETLETKQHDLESKKESPKLVSKEQEKLRNKIDTHEQLLAELKKREEARIEQENQKKEREEQEQRRQERLEEEKRKCMEEERKKMEEEKKQKEKELLHEKMLQEIRKKEEERRQEQERKCKILENNQKKAGTLNTMLSQLEKMVCEAQKTQPKNIQKIQEESSHQSSITFKNGNNLAKVNLIVKMNEKQLSKMIKN